MQLPRTANQRSSNAFSWITTPLLLLSVPCLRFLAYITTRTSNVQPGPLAKMQVAALTMSNSEIRHIRHSSPPCSLSLWLVPKKKTKKIIQTQIDAMAENHGGPTFQPHVTVVGNIPCHSDKDALKIAKNLQDSLRGFGKVPCVFSSSPYASDGVWNQALLVTMEKSAPFMNLCQKTRAILGMDTKHWGFPQPAGMPHMSLFYGVDNVPGQNETKPISPFDTSKLALWKTDPPTLEGVPYWKEIAVINLR